MARQRSRFYELWDGFGLNREAKHDFACTRSNVSHKHPNLQCSDSPRTTCEEGGLGSELLSEPIATVHRYINWCDSAIARERTKYRRPAESNCYPVRMKKTYRAFSAQGPFLRGLARLECIGRRKKSGSMDGGRSSSMEPALPAHVPLPELHRHVQKLTDSAATGIGFGFG
jgi:hypothetical protein